MENRAFTRAGNPPIISLYLVLALAALLPRVLDLGGFVTLDEITFWFGRSERFLGALRSGDYAATAITSHPGVTTMWLGSAAILLRDALWDWGLLADPAYATWLTLERLPAAIVHTLGVVVSFHLLQRMLPLAIGFLAALFWAADPFVLAFSRILHTDALLATFATLSILAALIYWNHCAHWSYLVLSAVCGALAVLSKSPGLAVLPIVGLAALVGQHGAWSMERLSAIGYRLSASGYRLSLWAAIFALTILLVWPATWAAPYSVYDLLRFGVEAEGAQPHMQGNFFLGQPVETPDARFYPAVLALRSTPLTLIGLLLLPVAWRWAGLSAAQRRDMAILALTVLLFTLAFSLFPKKFNRYLVPAFPALDVLAAVGWGGALYLVGYRLSAISYRLCVAVLATLALLNVAHWHPYSVVAYNQMLGGARAGANTFMIGWGEGMGQAADWLNQQPDITGVLVASTQHKTLQPYLVDGAQTVDPADSMPPRAGYALLDISYLQRDRLRPPFTAYYQHATPLHVVTLHGVPYVWLYDLPRPIAHPVGAQFGEHLTLQGYELATPPEAREQITLTVQWQTAAPLAQDYLMFAHLLDTSGARIAQIDAPPAGPAQPTTTWEPGRYRRWSAPLPVPADLEPGRYWLALGVYDPKSFARLPLSVAPPPDAPAAGPDALLLSVEIMEN